MPDDYPHEKPLLRLAVAGLGWAGTRHVEAVRELGRKVEVVALMDTDAAHLATRAAELSVATTTSDFASLLADSEIDAVSICTPHALHCPMTLAALEAGKHVLVEKPMALTVEEATRMIDGAAANGVKLFVAEQAAYTPQARLLRSVVQSREPIGAITAASVRYGFRAPDFGYPGRRAWLTTLEEGGTGTWMLQGIHTVAEMRYILGEVATVYMHEHKTSSFVRSDLEGTMSGLLTLESGVAVSIVHTCESKIGGDLSGYTLHGEQGNIVAGKLGYRLFNAETGDALPALQPYPEAALSPYALEMDAFADYVYDVGVGPTTAASERRSLAIVQAGYESAQSGAPVNLRARFGAL